MKLRQTVVPLLLIAAVVVAAVVAASLGKPVWAAVVGAGLVVAYWGLEVLSWHRGETRATFGGALGVALGGMVLRLAMVLVVLTIVGLAAKPAFGTAAISFLGAFTVYTIARFFAHPAAGGPASQAGARP